MKKEKFQCSEFEYYSDAEKLKYKEKVFDLSQEICSDENILSRLISYTLKKMRRFAKYDSINGLEAQDFIQEAILKTAEGVRFWPGTSLEELLYHFYFIIPSLISNELKKTKITITTDDEFGTRKVYKDKFVSHNPAEDDEKEILEIIIKGTDTSDLDRLIMQETIKKTESYIYDELEKNEDYIGTYLYQAKINGEPNPHLHVAKILNIPIEDVRNADKRLKRIINKSMRF